MAIFVGARRQKIPFEVTFSNEKVARSKDVRGKSRKASSTTYNPVSKIDISSAVKQIEKELFNQKKRDVSSQQVN